MAADVERNKTGNDRTKPIGIRDVVLEDLGASRAVAMHYGTFRLSDEPLDEPPKRFKAAAKESPFGEEGAWLLKIGETRTF